MWKKYIDSESAGWGVVIGIILTAGVGLIFAFLSPDDDLSAHEHESSHIIGSDDHIIGSDDPIIGSFEHEGRLYSPGEYLDGMAHFEGDKAHFKFHNNSEVRTVTRLKVGISGPDDSGKEVTHYYGMRVIIPPMSTRSESVTVFKTYDEMDWSLAKAWGTHQDNGRSIRDVVDAQIVRETPPEPISENENGLTLDRLE